MVASDPSAAVTSQPPPAQVVGNAFVQQFYQILYQSPQLVYRFYQESSKLGRPDANGTMVHVTTMQAINEKILAMDYGEIRAEIRTVDAQESLNGGVLVLVTGYLTGKDLVKKDFMQSFFLAPQDKGFYVLNDVFRYVDDVDHQVANGGLPNGNGVAQAEEEDSPPHEHVIEEQTPSPAAEEEEENGEEVYNPPEKEADPAIVEEEVPIEEVINEVPNVSRAVVVEAIPANTVPEEAPKKSYASIVKVMKENPAPLSLPTPPPARPAPSSQERHSAPVPGPALVLGTPSESPNVTENSSVQEAGDGYSIYVKSLPLTATAAQLEEEFKKFGPIKPDGIQVRSHMMQGFCFGFVEFEVASAVQSALEASPIMIGGRQVFVEEKRTTNTRLNNRGKFPSNRGAGFRSGGGVRGRGNYGGGRGYGRGEYNNNRSDFGNRGGSRGGSSARGGDVGYQRVDHVGGVGGRGSRSGSLAGNSSPKSVTPPASS